MRLDQAGFAALLARLGNCASEGDADGFAALFTPDAVYDDYIYGPHQGRTAIIDMLQNLFWRDAGDYDWRFFDPVTNGEWGYARSLSTFVSKIPAFQGKSVLIDGISRFRLSHGLIAYYGESVNAGVAMVQLGVEPARMEKRFRRWADELNGRAESRDYVSAARARFAR